MRDQHDNRCFSRECYCFVLRRIPMQLQVQTPGPRYLMATNDKNTESLTLLWATEGTELPVYNYDKHAIFFNKDPSCYISFSELKKHLH